MTRRIWNPRTLTVSLGSLISRWKIETYEGINTDNYTTEEILDEISNLESQKSSIEREIELFDQYCDKFGIPDIPLPSENVEKLSSRKKKRQNQEKKLEKLNISQKNDIVSKLIDSEIKEKAERSSEHTKKLERFEDELEQLVEQLKGTFFPSPTVKFARPSTLGYQDCPL